MTNWNHVEDALIRSVLNGDLSEDALCYAISKTLDHAMADQENEDLPYAVSEQRLALAYDASDAWNVEGDAFDALECLKACWAN
jgi:hypothetical protein